MAPAPSDDERARRSFVADPASLSQLQLSLQDLDDEDMRLLAIRAEHPELDEALEVGAEEVDGPDGPMSPRLHLAIHGVVANQLWEDSPPEMWQTAVRLLDAGYDRHEIFHMLGSTVATQIWETWHERQPYDRDAHLAALAALPDSWERGRTARRLERGHETARRRTAATRQRARRQARASRRRNRRG